MNFLKFLKNLSKPTPEKELLKSAVLLLPSGQNVKAITPSTHEEFEFYLAENEFELAWGQLEGLGSAVDFRCDEDETSFWAIMTEVEKILGLHVADQAKGGKGVTDQSTSRLAEIKELRRSLDISFHEAVSIYNSSKCSGSKPDTH